MEYPPANLLKAPSAGPPLSVSTCGLPFDPPEFADGFFSVMMKKVMYVHEVLHIGDNTATASYNYRNLWVRNTKADFGKKFNVDPDLASYKDWHGKNQPVNMFADYIRIFNDEHDVLNTDPDLNLRYVAIFTTKTDCSSPFVWNMAEKWLIGRESLQQIEFRATIAEGDCPVAHSVALADGSSLPAWLVYDARTCIFQARNPTSDALSFEV